MKGEIFMRLDRNMLLTVLSEALDRVEEEVLGVTDYHAKRVAWMCMQMGQRLGMAEEAVTDLAICAMFHDSALTEYQNDYCNRALRPGVSGQSHCAAGEKHVSLLLGRHSQPGAVLYHHERADGQGPFGKTAAEVPLSARLIHVADELDLHFALGTPPVSLDAIRQFVQDNAQADFGDEAARCMLEIMTEQSLAALQSLGTHPLGLPPVWLDTAEDSGATRLNVIARLFAKIIDFKSPFTRIHSLGVAEKAKQMAVHNGWDKEAAAKMYFAGALHDIGKLMADRAILEKPGRLNEAEYRHIQLHAYETWRLLSKVPGLEQVTGWASFHHEKLNGKGYPFGKKAEALSCEERLMACLDIYQALTEDRPYKAGMAHRQAIGILREMADKGELDGTLVADLDAAFAPDDRESAQQQACNALFQCRVCGYLFDGNAVPQSYICPVCSAAASDFLRVFERTDSADAPAGQ